MHQWCMKQYGNRLDPHSKSSCKVLVMTGRWTIVPLVVVCSLYLFSCGGIIQPEPGQLFQFDFANGAQGWSAGFSDYPAGQEAFFELASGIKPLPSPLDQTRTGFFISGNNHSDDLFMFLKVRITGLKPATAYNAGFHVEFATNESKECVGIGGAPGKSVWVKTGASAIEPQPVLQSNGQFLMNIDKGNQSVGGKDATVVGTVENSSTDCQQPVYETKMLANAGPFTVRTDAAGRLWFLLGTDSGFEGTTSLYYRQFRAALTELPQ